MRKKKIQHYIQLCLQAQQRIYPWLQPEE
jgi:hypothetical protein